MRVRGTVSWVIAGATATLIVSAGSPVRAADGVSLRLAKGPGADELTLSWTGGQPLFRVYRSTDPATVIDPANLVVETTERSATVTSGMADVEYFRVSSPCVVAPPEICDGVDNDCNGTIDEPGSESSCALPHATAHACVGGMCVPDTCDSGWDNCDGIAANGCEIDLMTDVSNCTACGVVCSFPHATAVCDGMCALGSCDPGYLDCDADASNGCEIDSTADRQNCGSCGNVCTLPNALSACDGGSCQQQIVGCLPDWWDIDGVTGNGCEYACVFQSATDLPDSAFIDANCDGIDGTVARAVFVSQSGSDANPGTMSQPVRSIAQGFARAQSQGRDHVYVAAGTYYEQVTLRNGISIWGMFLTNLTGTWPRASANTVIVRWGNFAAGRSIAMTGSDVTVSTIVADLSVEAGELTSIPEASVYGLWCQRCDGLTFERNEVTTSSGSFGRDGGFGTAGARGGDGTSGSPGSCDTNTPGGVGGAGGTSDCGHYGGAGGRGGSYGANPGQNGQGGSFGTPGGLGGAGGDPGRPGNVGGNGAFASDPVHGTGGAGGSVIGGYWQSASGGTGSQGGHGNGGGGGGGGGGQGCLFCDDGPGNGGGGGGGGGCGGNGGGGGTGGGGSFGLFLVDSTGVIVRSNSIYVGAGGAGGAGGFGGSGGGGGLGGPGAAVCTNEVGRGGAGGNGSAGKAGGYGGGGAGGPSVGVFRHNSTASIISNVFILGGGGAGGASNGNDGMPGETSQVH